MITITKERLLTIKQWRETYGPGSNVVLPAEEAEELARIALASLEQNVLSGNSPLIPGEVLSAIREVARIRADFDDFDGDRRGSWISCSEQMPSAGEQVLAYRPDAPESNDPLIKMATYVGGSAHGHGFDCYCKPTHWMPLPAAPQEVNRG
ncbi:DUF551 domain-containing protein [Escherichia coli]|nr:DUF551 domain-containing protein [Escherichia coli]